MFFFLSYGSPPRLGVRYVAVSPIFPLSSITNSDFSSAPISFLIGHLSLFLPLSPLYFILYPTKPIVQKKAVSLPKLSLSVPTFVQIIVYVFFSVTYIFVSLY